VSECACACQGISFADFKEFCQFLNNLDDFALAMKIYTYASQPISEGTSRSSSSSSNSSILRVSSNLQITVQISRGLFTNSLSVFCNLFVSWSVCMFVCICVSLSVSMCVYV